MGYCFADGGKTQLIPSEYNDSPSPIYISSDSTPPPPPTDSGRCFAL